MDTPVICSRSNVRLFTAQSLGSTFGYGPRSTSWLATFLLLYNCQWGTEACWPRRDPQEVEQKRCRVPQIFACHLNCESDRSEHNVHAGEVRCRMTMYGVCSGLVPESDSFLNLFPSPASRDCHLVSIHTDADLFHPLTCNTRVLCRSAQTSLGISQHVFRICGNSEKTDIGTLDTQQRAGCMAYNNSYCTLLS